LGNAGAPVVFAGQLRQAVSGGDEGGASGAGQASGMHVAAPGAASVVLSAHAKAPTRQVDRAASGEEPAGHVWQSADPAGAYWSCAQRAQRSAEAAPRELSARPAGHGAHALLPTNAEKEPSSHGAQSARPAAPGCARAVPAGQKESHTVAPGVDTKEPGAQKMHAARPATGE